MKRADDSRWNTLDAAFASALDRPEAERCDWARETFADRPEVLSGVLALLQEEAESRARFDTLLLFRDRLADDLSLHLDDADEDPRVGAHYGPWRVLRRIASGGLSVVYEACRSDGRYEQRVALKVMHAGMHNGEAVRHFLRERRILSSLDHPGIVRILDGGETATGAPWLVMDLVAGRPLTDYCTQAGLNLRARLSLMAEIADAVQSAHSRLVVHRDIKPENIIVSDEGRARLLDFGVSSLMAGGEGGEAGYAMTPEYASPEQLRLEDVTTASDIWQLGRVLEELCDSCGPVPPDVRAVIAKAMARRVEDRYESVAGFAADLRRLVGGQAPLARPDSRGRALLRLVRHNKIAAGLCLLLVLGLAGWGATLTVHARQMQQERSAALAAADRAERGREVLLNLFRRLDPLERDGVPSIVAAADSLVAPTLSDVRARLPDDPALQAELLGWAARIRQREGNLDKARALAQEDIDVLRKSGDTSSTVYAAALAYLGHVDMLRGEADLANSEIAEALAIATPAPMTDASAFDAILSAAWASDADWRRQRELLDQALPRALAIGSVNGEIEVRSGLGRALSNLGATEEGEAEIRKALALTEEAFGADHPRMTLPLSDLGRLLFRLGRPAEAVTAHSRALAIAETAYGPLSAEVLSHRNNLAIALLAAGREEEAIAELQTVISILERTEGSDSQSVGEALQNLAAEQSASGRLQDALTSLDRAAPILKKRLPQDSPRRAYPALTRSGVLLELRRYDEARDQAQEAFDLLSRTLPEGHYATEIARCRIGLAEFGLGQNGQARRYLKDALEALKTQPSAPADYVASCRSAGRALGLPE